MKKVRIRRLLPEIIAALKTIDAAAENKAENDAATAIDPDIDFLMKIPLAHVEKYSIQLDIVNEDDFTPYADDFFSSFSSFRLDDGSLFSRYETNVPELALRYAIDNCLSLKPNERKLFVHDNINNKTVENKYVKVIPKLTLV